MLGNMSGGEQRVGQTRQKSDRRGEGARAARTWRSAWQTERELLREAEFEIAERQKHRENVGEGSPTANDNEINERKRKRERGRRVEGKRNADKGKNRERERDVRSRQIRRCKSRGGTSQCRQNGSRKNIESYKGLMIFDEGVPTLPAGIRRRRTDCYSRGVRLTLSRTSACALEYVFNYNFSLIPLSSLHRGGGERRRLLCRIRK